MIFVDTWAWIALSSRRDQYHAAAQAVHRQISGKQRYVTSYSVLSELITYLYGNIDSATADAFINSILWAGAQGIYEIVEITPERFGRAWVLRQKYRDKPDISFVDLTSIVVMQELGINDIFTGDAHFQRVNLGFRLLPGPGA
jgi:predicted nucleic acid-binding protein